MIVLQDVSKVFRADPVDIRALDRISLEVSPGEFLVVQGPSGSGKTTLLMTIAGMLRPSGGTVQVNGRDPFAMSAEERACFRAREIGMIFQEFYLVPYLTVRENVLLAAASDGGEVVSRATALLGKLGLDHRASQRASDLSTGEKQRTAVARALINQPRDLLADEPTGNLDPSASAIVLEELKNFRDSEGTVVLATHSESALEIADRVVFLRSGQVFSG